MPFNFKVNPLPGDHYNYEGVRVLKGTPKNPHDYNDIQDSLRYRMTMYLKELYGNMRVPKDDDTFTIVNNVIRIKGTWYLDGYRFELLNEVSLNFSDMSLQFPFNGTAPIYLIARFNIVDYTEDPTIALHDQHAQTYIPTSERVEFVYELSDSVPAQSPDTAAYHIADLNGNNGVYTITHASGINSVLFNYSQALTNIINAVFRDQTDGYVYFAPNVITDIYGKARTLKVGAIGDFAAFMRQSTKKDPEFGIQSISGKMISGRMNEEQNNKYWPSFEVTSYYNDSYKSLLKHDQFEINSYSGLYAFLSPVFLTIRNNASYEFTVTDRSLAFITATGAGLSTKLYASDESSINILGSVGEGTQHSVPIESIYHKGTLISHGQHSSYAFNLNKTTNASTNYKYVLNYKTIRYVDNGTNDAHIRLTIYYKEGLTTVEYMQFNIPIPKYGSDIADSLMFYFNHSVISGNVFSLIVKCELINGNANTQCVFLLKKDNELLSEVYTWHTTLTDVEGLRINNHTLWIDDNGVPRLKKINKSLTAEDTGSKLYLMKYTGLSSGQASVDDDTGARILTGVNLNFGDHNITEPSVSYSNGSANINIYDVANLSHEGSLGLVSRQWYNNVNTLLSTSHEIIPCVYLVSKDFTNDDAAKHRFKSFQSCLTHIRSNYLNSGNYPASYTVLVYPGVYDLGGASIKVPIHTNIISLSLENTWLYNGTLEIDSLIPNGSRGFTWTELLSQFQRDMSNRLIQNISINIFQEGQSGRYSLIGPKAPILYDTVAYQVSSTRYELNFTGKILDSQSVYVGQGTPSASTIFWGLDDTYYNRFYNPQGPLNITKTLYSLNIKDSLIFQALNNKYSIKYNFLNTFISIRNTTLIKYNDGIASNSYNYFIFSPAIPVDPNDPDTHLQPLYIDNVDFIRDHASTDSLLDVHYGYKVRILRCRFCDIDPANPSVTPPTSAQLFNLTDPADPINIYNITSRNTPPPTYVLETIPGLSYYGNLLPGYRY